MISDTTALESAILEAHAANDLPALVDLYSKAADIAEGAGDVEGACFYLTHSYVFALQSGSGRARAISLRLWQHGRDERLPDGSEDLA